MKDNEKAFYMFYDWIDDLDYLDGADAWKVVKAISEYHRHGISPLEGVDGTLRVIVSIMFHQIKRGEAISEIRRKAGQQGGFATSKNSKAAAEPKQKLATEYSIQNTDNNIHSLTLTSAPAHTREEDKEAEWIPREERKKLEEYLKEQTKQRYIGGELGKGVVFLSGDQLNSLLDELSSDEFDKYVGIVADCELGGKNLKTKHTTARYSIWSRRTEKQEE